ncbi:hypothetical protein D3H65_10000 [Paraflavitalea soli]|uniref:DUF4870 domain-containing protein n=1 Tax=Paraflavitalea soli TaxID=2315862 RepID=A0A3B7MKV0_9BACT|nr:hypothetical protein [Paraflavitalea soli]AXY74287.1 hypothetical protein D3H65_10000 [Paraflavitalea soli]
MFKRIAPLCYLTVFGFIVAVIMFTERDEKKSVDSFHIRQALGLYLTGLLFMAIYSFLGSNLFYADLSSLVVLIPLFVLWLMGFKWAMEDKEKAFPIIGRSFQRLFSFIK